MDFQKIILGKYELEDFEKLLIREKWLDIAKDNIDILDKPKRIINKSRLLLSLLLFEKIDAVTLSSYDLSKLVDEGLVDTNACMLIGTAQDHPTLSILDASWEYKKNIVAVLFAIIDDLFRDFGFDTYIKNSFSEEDMLQLCDSVLYGDKQDFAKCFDVVITQVLNKLCNGPIISLDNTLDEILDAAHQQTDKMLDLLTSVKTNNEWFQQYCSLRNKIDSSVTYYSVPAECSVCNKCWCDCVPNSEFFGTTIFSCPAKEELGMQRFGKFNGLIASSTQKATLFDNSMKFRAPQRSQHKIIEDVYHIVNIDLSNDVGSLPIPQNLAEAMRLRARPEIKSFRNVFLSWCNNMYNGDVTEAEYIKRDFEAATKFFKEQEKAKARSRSIFNCSCEILGGFIPYLSTVTGVIGPINNLKEAREEEKYRWLLLTR